MAVGKHWQFTFSTNKIIRIFAIIVEEKMSLPERCLVSAIKLASTCVLSTCIMMVMMRDLSLVDIHELPFNFSSSYAFHSNNDGYNFFGKHCEKFTFFAFLIFMALRIFSTSNFIFIIFSSLIVRDQLFNEQLVFERETHHIETWCWWTASMTSECWAQQCKAQRVKKSDDLYLRHD